MDVAAFCRRGDTPRTPTHRLPSGIQLSTPTSPSLPSLIAGTSPMMRDSQGHHAPAAPPSSGLRPPSPIKGEGPTVILAGWPSPLVGEGARRADEGEPQTPAKPATEFLQILSPSLQPPVSFPRPLHRSEIMTSGWCRGGWVDRPSGRSRSKARAAWSGSPDKPLSRGVEQCLLRQGSEAAGHGQRGSGIVRSSGSASVRPHRSRDAARDAPEPSCHKPKTPIGRRGVSLIHSADYRYGANASPVRRFAL